MRKFTVLLFALCAIMCGLQVNAAPNKGPQRSNVYTSLPSGYQQVAPTSIYYSIARRYAAGPGWQYGVSILGRIGNRYYSSTFEHEESGFFSTPAPGAGFIAALQVNNGTPNYMSALGTDSQDGVDMTTTLEPAGEVAARIVYTLTNTTREPVTINAGVWADIMIGTNDAAPLEQLRTSSNAVYGIKMKSSTGADAPLLCVLFGEHVTGVTPVDDFWHGFYSSNWHPNEIVGQYSSEVYDVVNWAGNTLSYPDENSDFYMLENGSYDSGLGFCWKDRTIEPGESIELSYLISVGEIDFEEPIDPDPEEPGEDIFTYNVEAYNFAGWNDLTVGHPAHIWGHYEHPYGQEGYIEYQVDDENTWHRISTALVSGEDYDLPFDMMFNPYRATDHVLKLRFNDGLDNIVELNGLEWIDVRSIPVTVTCQDEPVYNGQPHLFDVTVDRGTVTIGQNGEYVDPGTYHYTALVGVFEDWTIAENIVEFSIDKGHCIIDVTVPERVAYDGFAHGATVTLLVGDGQVTVIYKDAHGNEIVGEPTEVGTYEVFVEVSDGQYYYGIQSTSYGFITIYETETGVKELNAGTQGDNAWYTIDGIRVSAPTQRGIYIHNGKKYIVK